MLNTLTYINQQLLDICQSDPYNLDETRVFTLTDNKVEVIHTGEDVYNTLSEAPKHLLLTGRKFSHYGVETSGWAAPLGDTGNCEGTPSEHPERKRCRMVSVISRTGEMSSLLLFQGEDEPVCDNGEATGSLADALKHSLLWAVVATFF